MRTCPKCGNNIDNDSAKFCKKCGTSLQIPSMPKEEKIQGTEANFGFVSHSDDQRRVQVGQTYGKTMSYFTTVRKSISKHGFMIAIAIVSIILLCGMGLFFMKGNDVDYSSMSPIEGRATLKQEILSSINELGLEVKDDSLNIVFSSYDINYIVQIDEAHYDPMYTTISAVFELSEDYNSDIARRAAINAASGMPVFCDCIDNILVFDCEMYLKDSKSFTSVLTNMVNAIKTSVDKFDGEYDKLNSTYEKKSLSLTSNISDIREKSAKVYDNPSHSTSNDNKLLVLKVYWEGRNTVVEFKSYNGGEYQWCSIEKNSYLLVDGNKYPLTRAEGIAYTPKHTDYPNFQSGDNVSLKFKLYFSAIPLYTKSFDFYESGVNGWVVKNIKLEDK